MNLCSGIRAVQNSGEVEQDNAEATRKLTHGNGDGHRGDKARDAKDPCVVEKNGTVNTHTEL